MECLTPKQLQQLHDDIRNGVCMIVEKEHYYQLEAQAKSQPALLAACEDGYNRICKLQNAKTRPSAREYSMECEQLWNLFKTAISAANVETT